MWNNRSYVMCALQARIGRHRQRYNDGFRLVAGCIPYRLRAAGDDINIEERLEVLMITSPNRDDLIFPKGGWENDETVHAAACREGLEEAGVKGKLDEVPLGVWEFRSKSKQSNCTLEGLCRGYMFAMEVTMELENWPEQTKRDRKWLPVIDALQFCRYAWMQEALRICHLRVLIEGKKPQVKANKRVAVMEIGPISPDVAEQSSCGAYFGLLHEAFDASHLETRINAFC